MHFSVVERSGFDDESAAMRHRIAGVAHQIEQRLLQLRGVGVHGAHMRVKQRHEVDVLPDDPTQ